jgi:hypothetical protein
MRLSQSFGEGRASGVASKGRIQTAIRAVGSLTRSAFGIALLVSGFLFLSLAFGPAEADSVSGAWLSPLEDNWPLVAVHAALTPDGRVLTFGSNSSGQATGYFQYDVWDPNEGLAGGHLTLQNMTLTDIFCSYAVIVPEDGNVLIAGGDNWDGTAVKTTGNDNSTLYEPSDNTLTRANDMRRPRWYAMVTPLLNGEMYIQGGKNGGDYPEVRDSAGNFRLLTGIPTGSYDWWYPRNFLAPDGRVFGWEVDGQMYWIDPTGLGSVVSAGHLDITQTSKVSTAVMFRPGKILQVVGKNRHAYVIDINGAQPVVTATTSLAAKRVWANSTVLPNGKVVVTGGSGADEELIDVTNYAEIWDPQTGKWTVGAAGSRPRLYHSFALLLPDASVLVGGGGASLNAPVNNLHAEIYYPAYLFSQSGGFAARPSIVSAPDVLTAGQSFTMQVSESVQRVTLLQAGSATHSNNMQQRFVELAFSEQNQTLYVDMPTRATDVPPGYYLLFVLNGNGVPSRAKIVRIPVAGGGSEDVIAPSAPSGLLLSKVNGNPKLDWVASTDNVGVAGYSIHRSTDGSFGPEIAVAPSTTWTDTNVVEGTKYWYAVKAFDAAGNMSASSAKQSIIAFQIPTKPKNFKVALQDGHPKLSFDPATDNVGVVGYNVYRSIDGSMGPLYAQIAGSPWVDNSAQSGVTFTYAVRARDAAGYLSNPTALKSILTP